MYILHLQNLVFIESHIFFNKDANKINHYQIFIIPHLYIYIITSFKMNILLKHLYIF